MRQLLQIFFLCSCFISFGQNSFLNNAISWFGKTDRTTIDNYLKNCSYQFIGEKDSLDLHFLTYSLAKTENGTQPFIHMLLGDSALELISIDTYSQGNQLIVSGLKSGRFKSIGTVINGNFITTTYDNGNFLIQEDYEAVPNPIGKGEIAYFRYRIVRKYGQFDSMNGEKIRFTEEGLKIAENYKNGLLDGQRTIYFPNGSIKRTENYRSGRLNGTASDYNPQGKLVHSSIHSYHWKYGLEKWYNNEEKLVKSLQWRRDIPTGIEKQTFNGITIGSVSYAKGFRQGPAKVPVYFDPHSEANYPLDTLNDAPIGIEDVAFDKGLKSGKAICTYFNTTDTMYVAYYKAGQLDSTFLRYTQNSVLYTTTFSNGLEHGKRIYRIPSGPLKDTVYRMEQYQNGKLNGQTIHYYKKQRTSVLTNPESEFHVEQFRFDYPETFQGQWIKVYELQTYKEGIPDGVFVFWKDSLNFSKGSFLKGKLQGFYESVSTSGKQQVKTKGQYENGLKAGDWETESVNDDVLLTEHYETGKKNGNAIRNVSGYQTEERFYSEDTLKRLQFFEKDGNLRSFDINFLQGSDSVQVTYELKEGSTNSRFSYLFSQTSYSGKETALASIASSFESNPQIGRYLNGPFMIKTVDYELFGTFKDGKWNGCVEIIHLKSGIFERLDYQNGIQNGAVYTQIVTCEDEPYTGTFISAESNEKISVKNGLRHGWCVGYDTSGRELRRMKYVKGVLKKAIERKLD